MLTCQRDFSRLLKTHFNIKTEGFKFLVEVAGKATLVIYLVWKIEGKLAKLWMMAFA
jgi:hypothetical protein